MVGPLKQLHKSLTLFACAIFCRCDGRHGGCVVQVSLCVSLRLFNGIKQCFTVNVYLTLMGKIGVFIAALLLGGVICA